MIALSRSIRSLVPLLVATAALAQSTPLDMRAALAMADSSNLDLRASRQQRAIALAGLSIARQFPNPTLSFSAARDVPHESVVWDQPIEIGGKRGRRIEVARQEQKVTEIDIAVLARQIRHRTREAFYRVLLSREQTQQAKAALDISTRLKNIVQQRFEVGDVAELEVIQADVEMARAQAEYEVTAQSQKSAEVQLAALLGAPLDRPVILQGQLNALPLAPDLPRVNELALQSNADVQRTMQELATEQSRTRLAKAQRIPNLDLQGGVDLNAPPDFQVGPRGQIGVNLPIFYHGQGEVAASSSRVGFLQLSLQAQKTNAASQAAAAYFDYIAKQTLASQYSNKVVPQTVKLEEMSEDSYRSGKTNLLPLIDSQRRLNEVRRAYLDNLFAVQSSFANLEEVLGAPLD